MENSTEGQYYYFKIFYAECILKKSPEAAHSKIMLSNGGFRYDFYFICIVKKIWLLLTNIYFCSIFFSGLIHSFT